MEHECLKELKELKLFDYYATHIMQGIISQNGIFHSELEGTINQVYDTVEKMLILRKERFDSYRKEKTEDKGGYVYLSHSATSTGKKPPPKPVF